MKILSIFIATIAMIIALALPAQSATGQMTITEFLDNCFASEISCTPSTPSQVESNCNCTGDTLQQWNANGYQHKRIYYNNSYGFHQVSLHFRRSDNNSPWRLRAGEFCVEGGCLNIEAN